MGGVAERAADHLVFELMRRIRPAELRPRPLGHSRADVAAEPGEVPPRSAHSEEWSEPDRWVSEQRPELIGLTADQWGKKIGALRILGGTPPSRMITDVIASPRHRALFTSNGELIEESLRTRRGRDQLPGFTAPDRVAVPKRLQVVSQPQLYAGTIHRHFGHFLLEGTARLWPQLTTDSAVLADPERHPAAASHRHTVLTGLGLADRPPRFVPQATMFRQVTVAAPSFEYGGSAWAMHRAIPQMVASLIAPEAEVGASEQPLYLSRENLPGLRRHAVDEGRLVRELRGRGFLVVSPEQLPFIEQVRLVRRHRTIVGLLGSALHLALFGHVGRGMTVHLVERDRTVRSDYPVIDALMQRRSAYIACTERRTDARQRGNDAVLSLDVSAAVDGLHAIGLID